MAVLDELEIVLEDAISQELIPEFDTEESHDSSTVRKVSKCLEVYDGQHFSFKIRTLANFNWHDGVTLDLDAGEVINRYRLYILRDLPNIRRLVKSEPILTKIASNNWNESTIKHLYIRSDIPDAYCQRGRLVFRNLRPDAHHPGGRKTVGGVQEGQGRVRVEVTRLRVEELFEARDIVLLKPTKCARTHKNILEKKGIYIETRVELDEDYEPLPKRKFVTRMLKDVEGRKQLNFVFEYRKEGIFKHYPSSNSETDESSIAAEDDRLNLLLPPTELQDQQGLSYVASSTLAPQNTTTPTHLRTAPEAITDREEAHYAFIEDVEPGRHSDITQSRLYSPEPSKQEYEVVPYPSNDSPLSRWHTSLGDYNNPTDRENPKPQTTGLSHCTPNRQILMARLRKEESMIERENQLIEKDSELHRQSISSLEDTELKLRESRYLQRQEHKRKRHALISRVETLKFDIKEEKRLFQAERSKLQALVESREQELFEERTINSESHLLQRELNKVNTAGARKRRRDE